MPRPTAGAAASASTRTGESGLACRTPIYLLSEKGRALIPALVALRAWSERFVPGNPSPLRLRTTAGEDVEVRLTTSDGHPVDVDDIVASTAKG